jgi:hypothetical protein
MRVWFADEPVWFANDGICLREQSERLVDGFVSSMSNFTLFRHDSRVARNRFSFDAPSLFAVR